MKTPKGLSLIHILFQINEVLFVFDQPLLGGRSF